MGEIVRVESVVVNGRYPGDPDAEVYVFAQPERRHDLEAVLVPKDDREWPTYGGYTLFIELGKLISAFELLPPAV